MKLFAFACGFLFLATYRAEASITTQEIREKSALGYHLLSLAEDVDPVWKSEAETFKLAATHIHFFDVTEAYRPNEPSEIEFSVEGVPLVERYPTLSHQMRLKPIISSISVQNMKGYLSKLAAFHNRFYKAETGQAASIWVRDTLQNITLKHPSSHASVALFNHTSWRQNSVIAKIPGWTPGPVTVLGAHIDSVNWDVEDPVTGRAPGEDDDGTGSVNLIEAFRALVSAEFRPRTPVEFHWYSGEEVGRVGSQAIANSYKDAGVSVKAMLQLDMTAYVKPGTKPIVGLIPDYVDKNLTTFIGSLVDHYTSLDWNITEPCGYACSDHASWTKAGYPAAFPFESNFVDYNPNIHTERDTIDVDGFSWEHTVEYTKLAAAFAYELGN